MEEKQLTEQELYEKELEQNPPKRLQKLDLRPGEFYFGDLSEDEKYQVFIRYFNDICSINKSTLQIVADLYVLLEFICENMGIDVKAKKMELARNIKAQMKENMEKSKEELKNAAKKA